jgi:hypothetical protein
VDDFSTAFSSIDRSSRKKNQPRNFRVMLHHRPNELRYLYNIPFNCCRTLILLSSRDLFSKIDHISGHKERKLKKFL